MVMFRKRFLRAGFLISLIAALVSMAAFDANEAIAKPYSDDGPPGEPTGTGDPTGDDLPSPTPKPNARAAKLSRLGAVQGGVATTQRRGGFRSSDRWGLYLRLLARLAVR